MKRYYYECDGGSLAVLVNGAKVCIGNGYGDGEFSVLVCDGEPFGHEFEFTGTNIVGPAKLAILDYDCSGGQPIGDEIELNDGDMAMFYNDTGDVVINIVRRKIND